MNGFSLWVGIGAALGLWRVARTAPDRQAEALVNLGLLVLLASLVGARLSYAWMNWAYFSSHLFEIPQVWLGGLSWTGAVAGAWLAMIYFSRTYRSPRGSQVTLGWMADQLYPLLPPVSITTWLGCWMVGSAYGLPVPAGTWWGVPSLDETGIYTLHWPLQPLSAISLLAFFWLLEVGGKRIQRAGSQSGLAFIGMLIHLCLTSLLCTDPGPMWKGQRVDTWIALFYLGIFVTFTIVSGISSKWWKNALLSNSKA